MLVSAQWGIMTAVSPFVYTAIFELDAPTFEFHVRVWLPGDNPVRETISHVFLSPPWGPQTTCTGDSCGADKRAWGANRRLLGAPAISGDGQVTIFNLEDIFADTGTVSLQAINAVPNLPTWVTQVGQGYRFSAEENFMDTRALAFSYLQREVPPGHEDTLAIYYQANNTTSWQRLDTIVDMDENQAAVVIPKDVAQGQGIYVLVATIEMASLEAGWNQFTYPNRDTRPVIETLISITGSYNTVYDESGHYIYDTTVPTEFITIVNNLEEFQSLGHYWIYVTQTVTVYVDVPDFTGRAAGITLPPATFYGWVVPWADYTPVFGDRIEAYVDGVLCGEGRVEPLNGQLAYKVVVAAAYNDNGCGTSSRHVNFTIAGHSVPMPFMWNNTQAQNPAPLGSVVNPVYLPMLYQ